MSMAEAFCRACSKGVHMQLTSARQAVLHGTDATARKGMPGERAAPGAPAAACCCCPAPSRLSFRWPMVPHDTTSRTWALNPKGPGSMPALAHPAGTCLTALADQVCACVPAFATPYTCKRLCPLIHSCLQLDCSQRVVNSKTKLCDRQDRWAYRRPPPDNDHMPPAAFRNSD